MPELSELVGKVLTENQVEDQGKRKSEPEQVDSTGRRRGRVIVGYQHAATGHVEPLLRHYIRSKIPAAPMPPPTHIVTMP